MSPLGALVIEWGLCWKREGLVRTKPARREGPSEPARGLERSRTCQREEGLTATCRLPGQSVPREGKGLWYMSRQETPEMTWSSNPQPWLHMGMPCVVFFKKIPISGPLPDLVDQNLWEWPWEWQGWDEGEASRTPRAQNAKRISLSGTYKCWASSESDASFCLAHRSLACSTPAPVLGIGIL